MLLIRPYPLCRRRRCCCCWAVRAPSSFQPAASARQPAGRPAASRCSTSAPKPQPRPHDRLGGERNRLALFCLHRNSLSARAHAHTKPEKLTIKILCTCLCACALAQTSQANCLLVCRILCAFKAHRIACAKTGISVRAQSARALIQGNARIPDAIAGPVRASRPAAWREGHTARAHWLAAKHKQQ